MKSPPRLAREPFPTALNMLARRGYSVAAMRRALEKKCPSHPGIREALHRLRELGYLDDQKYALQVASSLARNRGFGPFRVRRELKARLVDYKFIEPAIEQAFEETSEHGLLARALDKKLRALRPPVTPRKLDSLCRALLRRGFSSGDIMKAVRNHPKLRPAARDVSLEAMEEEEEQNSKW